MNTHDLHEGLTHSLLEANSKSDWDAKTSDPINLKLGDIDSLYHHHFGVTDYDKTILALGGEERQDAIIREMHRIETQQVDETILKALAPTVTADAHVVDAGSGRGGTSFMVSNRFGCYVHGVNFCQHHVDFATSVGRENGWDHRVDFTLANMTETPFDSGSQDFVVSNETTMYVDLMEAFAEFRRVLKPGGRYVAVTWCANDAGTGGDDLITTINNHYVCRINTRGQYFAALMANGLIPLEVRNLTADALPYWDLRRQSVLATGIEETYIEAHRSRALEYLVIIAEKAPRSHYLVGGSSDNT